MKFNIAKEKLLPALLKINGVVPRNPQQPILTHLLLKLEGEQLTLIGSDQDIQLQFTLQGVSSEGDIAITLPARKLTEICRNLNEGALLEFSIGESRTTLHSGRSRYTLSHLPARDYPQMRLTREESADGFPTVQLKIAQNDLHQLISYTQFSMANQDVRAYLNGLLLEFNGTHINAVATDGHRLAFASLESSEPFQSELESGNPYQMIIPRKSVTELLRLLDGNQTEPVILELGQKSFSLYFEQSILTSRLIDSRYPQYDAVIPKKCEQSLFMSVDADQLKQSLIRTSVLSNERYRGIRFTVSRNLLSLTLNNLEHEEAQEELEVDFPYDEKIEIGFNVTYVIDIINVIGSGTVTFMLLDSNSTSLVTVASLSNLCFVIMPMKI